MPSQEQQSECYNDVGLEGAILEPGWWAGGSEVIVGRAADSPRCAADVPFLPATLLSPETHGAHSTYVALTMMLA